MPSFNFKAGVFNGIFVGTYLGGDTLIPIPAVNFGPITINETLGETFYPGLQRTLQIGLHEVTINMSFYGDDDIVLKLARGLPLVGGGKDDDPQFSEYVLLLTHPDDTEESSFLFPRVRVAHNMTLNYEKTAVTGTQLTFLAQNRDRSVDLFKMDTVDNLAAELGVRSPV